ncbi:hypothetical protein GCM10012286_83630 [Streptomyces lasiicapitis]|uniref:Uncharacterized protein n=1 Tax=Streptomyces lasiicapitis TaxID=1923961 RepID=A0ABQ2MYA9_9ACTN|nr:hypothetical protein GCM10012286_83630 [Streptomyces lasiicapitis]
MIGFRPMSAPGTPEARIRARAPAMLRPWVTVRDLSSGIVARSSRVMLRGMFRAGVTKVERTPGIQDPDRVSG